MKKSLIILMVISVLVLLGCENVMNGIDTEVWQGFAGSAGIGFWAYGNDPGEPEVILVFIKTSSVSRVEYWEDREKIRSAEWLDCTGDTITYRAPNRETFTQTYIIMDNGLWFDESYGITWGGIFWRRERPSWWSWEFSGWPNLSGSSHNLTGSDGIGFWGAGDPDNPEHVWVFINTSSVSRVEYWINQELYTWGHWIDAIGNTIIYRQHDYINPAAQTYHIENNRLQIDEGLSGIAWGTFWRFEGPEWWILEER
jgi:predicted small secreted protein